MYCDPKEPRTSHAPQSFPFLELPLELRQMVYSDIPNLLAVSRAIHDEAMDTIRDVPVEMNINVGSEHLPIFAGPTNYRHRFEAICNGKQRLYFERAETDDSSLHCPGAPFHVPRHCRKRRLLDVEIRQVLLPLGGSAATAETMKSAVRVLVHFLRAERLKFCKINVIILCCNEIAEALTHAATSKSVVDQLDQDFAEHTLDVKSSPCTVCSFAVPKLSAVSSSANADPNNSVTSTWPPWRERCSEALPSMPFSFAVSKQSAVPSSTSRYPRDSYIW